MICPECKGERAVYRCFQNRITLTPCPKCNGVGEIVYTNFDRITDSPEKLAEFIADDRMHCHFATCDVSCNGCTKQGVLEWLNEESE